LEGLHTYINLLTAHVWLRVHEQIIFDKNAHRLILPNQFLDLKQWGW